MPSSWWPHWFSLGNSSSSKLHEEDLDRIQSPSVSDTVLELYYVVLVFLIDSLKNADEYVLLGTEALYDIWFSFLKLVTPTCGWVNHFVF